MKNLVQITDQMQHFDVFRFALVATSILIIDLAPIATFANPPATVASCQGIKDAYPILGTQCANAYTKINHAPANAKDRLTTYNARISVLNIFRKALLCNGIYGAKQSDQQRFNSEEQGHLMAIKNLRTAMTNAHDPNIPDLYTSKNLNSIKVNKSQCK